MREEARKWVRVGGWKNMSQGEGCSSRGVGVRETEGDQRRQQDE